MKINRCNRARNAVIGFAISTLIIACIITGTQKIHWQTQLDDANHKIELQHAQLQVLQPDAICP